MNKHCKIGIIWGFVAIPILISLWFGLGDTEKFEEIVSLVLALPALCISVILRADLSLHSPGAFGILDICKLIASFLIYYFAIGFTLGSVISLIITRFRKNKANPQQEATS